MNFFELHLEKIVLAVGILAAGVILALSFSGGSSKSASEITAEAVSLAEKISRDQEDNAPADQIPPPYQDRAGHFIEVAPLSVASVDRIALSPPYMPEIAIREVRQKISIPEIPPLKNVVIDFDRIQTIVLKDNQQQIEDTDFVTIEATLALAKIRQLFDQSFNNPDLTEPIEFPQPIIAAVELERSQLLPDGSWGNWEKVKRLESDPMAKKNIPSDNIADFTTAEYEVLLETRSNPETQLFILQPEPYKPLSGIWLTPSQKIEQQKLAKATAALPPTPPGIPGREARTPATRTDRGTRGTTTRGVRGTSRETRTGVSPRGTRTPPIPDRGSPMAPGRVESGAGRDMEMVAPGMMGPGMRPMEPGLRGEMGRGGEFSPGFGDAARGGFFTPEGYQQNENLLKKDEINLWAHDGDLNPDTIYRYRIKIGFFNPIAGKNWFTQEQQQLKDKIILWSSPVEPDKLVQIPPKTIFFPNSGSATAQTVRVDVYRWQNGRWHTKSFPITPGTTIGRLSKLTSDEKGLTTPPPNLADALIDFRTGATLLDVVPNTTHWCQIGSSFKNIITNDIIYRDADGLVKRLGVDNRCWPQAIKELRSQLNQSVRS